MSSSSLPIDRPFLARRSLQGKPHGPLLLRVFDGKARPENERIRLRDCDSGKSVFYSQRELLLVNDGERLARELSRVGSYLLSPVARAARRHRATEAKAAWEVRVQQEKAAADRGAREVERKRAEEAEREEALRRYRMAASADAPCWVGTVIAQSGLGRPAVWDPAAQESPATSLSLFMPPHAGTAVEARIVRGAVAPHQVPSLRAEHRRTAAEATLGAYRRWQEEERAGVEIPRAQRTFGQVVPDTEVPNAQLVTELDDVRLAMIWSDRQHRSVLEEMYEVGAKSMDAYRAAWAREPHSAPAEGDAEGAGRGAYTLACREMERLLSARMAEKAVKWLYRRMYPAAEIVDVAGSQVVEFEGWLRRARSPSGQPYHSHDLQLPHVDGGLRPIDVKNCRASYLHPSEYWRPAEERPRSYNEFCVPQFKKDRDNDVCITAVYSPYRRLSVLLDSPSDAEGPFMLGEVDVTTVDRLERESSDRFGVTVAFRNRQWNRGDYRHFLPPWALSLPREMYPAASLPPAGFEAHFRAAARVWKQLPDEYWPLFLHVANTETARTWVNAISDPIWRGFAEQLLQRGDGQRLSLPDLYLTVLGHFLATVRESSGTGTAFRPAEYRRYIFGNCLPSLPLGIYDPLRTVDSLIDTLGLMTTGDIGLIVGFTHFRFGHTGVLQASRDFKNWKTLLFPYCGGCGYKNLVLGKEGAGNCDTCGHLVCPRPECRFCNRTEECEKARSARRQSPPEVCAGGSTTVPAGSAS